MEVAIKTYDNKKSKIFDTALDKKKEIIITTTSDLQEIAKIELYLDNKKYKKYSIKDLVPVRAGVVNIKLLFEADDNLFVFSYFNKDNKKIENVINLNLVVIQRRLFKYLPYSPLLLLLPLLFFLSIRFYEYSFNNRKDVPLIDQKKEIYNDKENEIEIDTEKNKNENISAEVKEEKIFEDKYNKAALEEVIQKNTPIYFIENKAVLLKDENNKINNIVEYLKNYSKVNLLIEGHTDSIGKPKNELELSIKRAEFVKKRIESNLNDLDLEIKINGNGATKPAVPSNNKKDRYLNRRVEINIISAESSQYIN